MTRTEAHAILDAAKDGRDISCRAICEALQVTGDIDPERDIVQILRPVGTWRMEPNFSRRRWVFDALVERVELEAA